MKALNLDELKALIQKPHTREYLQCPSLIDGIPRGAISEISGNGKTQFVAQLLKEHPTLRTAWVEEHFSVNPFGLQQMEIKPNQIFFVEAGSDLEWALLQILKSQVFPLVVMYANIKDLKSLRRIQLATEKSHVATLWLTPKPQPHWTSSVQLKVSKVPRTNELNINLYSINLASTGIS
ncbi:MAG: hypothetical protein V4736_07535, partial [Bdellovibrionota bacterium]